MEREIITISENGVVAMPTAPVWMTMQEMAYRPVYGILLRHPQGSSYHL